MAGRELTCSFWKTLRAISRSLFLMHTFMRQEYVCTLQLMPRWRIFHRSSTAKSILRRPPHSEMAARNSIRSDTTPVTNMQHALYHSLQEEIFY